MSSSNNNNLPTVFTAPGMISDISIEVFGQAFFVNSTVLKVHSEYFRNYLDSPDKVAQAAPGAKFKYDWVTQVDEAGRGWSLTAKEKAVHDRKAVSFTGKPEEQIEAFKNLLSAMHNWSISIQTPRQLCLVAELADFYRVLPLMSNALHGVFYGNTKLVESIPDHCVELLEASFKLRNKLLFRECFVHIMGPWSKPRFMNLMEPKLKNLGLEAQQKLTSRILDVQLQFTAMSVVGPLLWSGKHGSPYTFATQMAEAAYKIGREGVGPGNKLIVPRYYRALYDTTFTEGGEKVKELIEPILKNVLVLENGAQAGQGAYKDSFLYFELTDQELPWNINQNFW